MTEHTHRGPNGRTVAHNHNHGNIDHAHGSLQPFHVWAWQAPAARSWVTPELRKLAVPDEFGRVSPFAVHVYYPNPGRELTHRNLSLADAERMADEITAEFRPGVHIHVSLDTCG